MKIDSKLAENPNLKVLILNFRVLPDMPIVQLRKEIELQLDTNAIPSKYVFVKNVGRHFTLVSFNKISTKIGIRVNVMKLEPIKLSRS